MAIVSSVRVPRTQSVQRLSATSDKSPPLYDDVIASTSSAREDTYLLLGDVKSDSVTYLNGGDDVQRRKVGRSASSRTVSLSLMPIHRPPVETTVTLKTGRDGTPTTSSVVIGFADQREEGRGGEGGGVGGRGTEAIDVEEEVLMEGEPILQRRRSSWWRRRKGSTRKAARDSMTEQQADGDHDCARAGCERLKINVSGQQFETRVGILNRHPTTLLGDGRKRREFYDREHEELFFDRHRPSFEAIFSYYQHGGRLKRPYHVPSDVFLDEIIFYKLEDDVVEEYKRSEGYIYEQTPMPTNPTMRRLWTLFEHPETSRTAFGIAVTSVFMTLVSIVLFCVETLPRFAVSHCVGDEMPNFADPFFIIETTCTAWFTVEAIIRFAACPNKINFWKDFKNVVDVVAIVPYYITLFNVLSTMSCSSAKSSASLSFLRVIRLIRVFKLTKHSVGLQVLLLTFRASLEGLGLFLVALIVSLLVFSSAIYYAELGLGEVSQMKSIPDAFWWAIITMTTVGYGDKVPVGYLGRLIGAACAITGVLTLAIPVPIITGHFNRFYSHKTGRGRHI